MTQLSEIRILQTKLKRRAAKLIGRSEGDAAAWVKSWHIRNIEFTRIKAIIYECDIIYHSPTLKIEVEKGKPQIYTILKDCIICNKTNMQLQQHEYDRMLERANLNTIAFRGKMDKFLLPQFSHKSEVTDLLVSLSVFCTISLYRLQNLQLKNSPEKHLELNGCTTLNLQNRVIAALE